MNEIRFTRNTQNTRSFGNFFGGRNPTRPPAPVAWLPVGRCSSSQVTWAMSIPFSEWMSVLLEIEIPCILSFLNRNRISQNSPKRMHPKQTALKHTAVIEYVPSALCHDPVRHFVEFFMFLARGFNAIYKDTAWRCRWFWTRKSHRYLLCYRKLTEQAYIQLTFALKLLPLRSHFRHILICSRFLGFHCARAHT